MDMVFETTRLRKLCSEHKKAVRKWGPEMAKKIHLRLDQVYAADTLEILMGSRLGRCHPLKGDDRRGQFSLDLVHPQRLILRPEHDPLPTLEDGGIDPSRVTVVRILAVEDTHD